MAKAVSKKKVVELESSLYSDAKHYARQIWLAGLGTYARVGAEGSEYFKELVKSGESVEKKHPDRRRQRQRQGSPAQREGQAELREDRSGVRCACRLCPQPNRNSLQA